ncbi:hypothetical protein OKW43_006952 [Paraburkholderia sp. WC7.3g]
MQIAHSMLRKQINQQQVVVRAVRDEIDAARLQHLAKRLRVGQHVVDIGLKVVLR